MEARLTPACSSGTPGRPAAAQRPHGTCAVGPTARALATWRGCSTGGSGCAGSQQLACFGHSFRSGAEQGAAATHSLAPLRRLRTADSSCPPGTGVQALANACGVRTASVTRLLGLAVNRPTYGFNGSGGRGGSSAGASGNAPGCTAPSSSHAPGLDTAAALLGGGVPDTDSLAPPAAVPGRDGNLGSEEARVLGSVDGPARAGMQLRGRRRLRSERSRASGDQGAAAAAASISGNGAHVTLTSGHVAGACTAVGVGTLATPDSAAGLAAAPAPTGSRQLAAEPRTAAEWCEQVMELAAEQQRLLASGEQRQLRSVRPQEEWLAAFMRGSLLRDAAAPPSRSGSTASTRPSATSAGTAASTSSSSGPSAGAGPMPLRLLVGAMSAVNVLYPRGEWHQLDLGHGLMPAEQVQTAASTAAAGQAHQQEQQQRRRAHGHGQQRDQPADPLGSAQGPQPLQAQWLQAWWRATAEAVQHARSGVGPAAAPAGRRVVAASMPEAEAARDLELLQLLQHVSSSQPALRAQTAAEGADGGWLGGSWRSGRALRRQARATSPREGEEAADWVQGRYKNSDSAAVAAAAAAGWRAQPSPWWRAAVADAVESRLVASPRSSRRSAGAGSGGGSGGGAMQQGARGETQAETAGAPAAHVTPTPAPLEARVALLHAYAVAGLWSRQRARPAQGQGLPRPRTNPASAVLQVVLAEWEAQQDLPVPDRRSPLSIAGLAALLRTQQLLGAPMPPAAAAAAVQMLDMVTSQLQPVPLTVLSDILAGVSTCPGALPPPAAATLAAVAERSLLAARQSGAGAGSEQRRQDGPALLEVVKSLSRLWARQQQQLQRQQGPRPAGRRGAPGQAEAANAYEAALDTCLPQLRRWLDSCSAAELLVASRSLITALRMRPAAVRPGAADGTADGAANTDAGGDADECEEGDEHEQDEGDAPLLSRSTWLGASLGPAGASQRHGAAPPGQPAPAVSAAWAAFEAASAPLLDGALPGGVLLQLAVDVSFIQPKSAVSPMYKTQLLRALTSAMEQSARRLAGMRGPSPGAGGLGASGEGRRGVRHSGPQRAEQPGEGTSGNDGSLHGGASGRAHTAYTRRPPPRPVPATGSPGVSRAAAVVNSVAWDLGRPVSALAGPAVQLLSPDQVSHAAAAAARLLSQDRFVSAAVARRMQAAVLVAAQAMRPRELGVALAALGELQLTGLTPTGSELLLKVLAARLSDLPPASLPLLLWSLVRMRLRPPSQWLAEYSRVVQQHVASYDMRQVAQLVWSYGQLVPKAPYSKMYFRPPRSLVRALLRCCLASFGGLESRALRLRRGQARAPPQPSQRTPQGQAQRRPMGSQPRPTAAHYAEMRPADCALVVAGLAGLEARPDSRWLRGLYRWSGPLLASFRAPDLGLLLYGLARLEAAPLPAWVRRAARCAELQLFHATGLDTAYMAYGLARLRPELVSTRLLTALEVFVPLQLQNGAQEALRVGGVQAQQEVEAAWADFLRSAHRELREAVASATPQRGGILRQIKPGTVQGGQRAGGGVHAGGNGLPAADSVQGTGTQQGRPGGGGMRLCRVDTGKSFRLMWPWRRH